MQDFRRSENLLTHTAKAVYFPTPDGLKLARIEAFDRPRFREDGWEYDTPEKTPRERREEPDPDDIRRAQRRARLEAFDIIMCNPDLDGFATFTYSPEAVENKADYGETYERFRAWLSNSVQRRGMKYIAVPELTKRGDVHFHAILTFDALKTAPARTPAGRAVRHNGAPVYNVSDWHHGFTTVQRVVSRGEQSDPREAVAKYIFKYMTKNAGAKLGGRYVLKGGDLRRPVEVLGDDPREFATEAELDAMGYWQTDVPIGDGKTELFRTWNAFRKKQCGFPKVDSLGE